MKKINNFLFQNRAKKYLNTNIREHRFVSYGKAKTILLLFESDFSEKNPQIRKIIHKLQQDGKKVCAWGFIDKKEVLTSILPEFRILHHKETDSFKKPLPSYINELDILEFDLLVDLTLKPIIPLQYIAMYAKALCKTGIKKTDLPIYDFMLDVDNLSSPIDTSDSFETTNNEIDETYLFNQIIFYLKSIQTND
ncbi:MAG: hypothetical protein GZ091_01100 [Paludibacter sp.]|nr:hypothetical protein [Paludibacter sp.]